MDTYVQKVKKELAQWDREMQKNSSWFFERWSQKLQKKVDSYIPEKVHLSLTKAMEGAIQGLLLGYGLLPTPNRMRPATLEAMDREAQGVIDRYKKVATVQGGVMGWGGFLLGAIDFPALIAIKIKCLEEIAWIYGFPTDLPENRLFLLKVFLLAFSGDACRQEVYREIRNWEAAYHPTLQSTMNWREVYTQYRESIELRKLLGFIPVVGAAVGAWANRSFIGDLGEVAINAYRLRYLQDFQPE